MDITQMKKIMMYQFGILFLYSCSNSNTTIPDKVTDDKVELIKTDAFCNCIYAGFKKDSLQKEDYSTWGDGETCECDPRIFTKTDSLAKKFADAIKPFDPLTTAMGDSTKKPIIAACMDFYKSKQLDSLIKSELKK